MFKSFDPKTSQNNKYNNKMKRFIGMTFKDSRANVFCTRLPAFSIHRISSLTATDVIIYFDRKKTEINNTSC